MAYSKVVFNNRTLIDLTADTITASDLRQGVTAHGANGEAITGTVYTASMLPKYFDLHNGYVSNGTWRYNTAVKYSADIYEVKSGHQYFFTLGGNYGNRFVMMFTTEDVSLATADIAGTALSIEGSNAGAAYRNITFIAEKNCYLAIYKDNASKHGVRTYLYDMTEQWI